MLPLEGLHPGFLVDAEDDLVLRPRAEMERADPAHLPCEVRVWAVELEPRKHRNHRRATHAHVVVERRRSAAAQRSERATCARF
jgi:hypothetical protein